MLIKPSPYGGPLKPARGLSQLIDLYELNYRRIERLVPELELPFSEAVSRADTDFPLYLTVMSRDRFTATFRLTYEFLTEQGLRRQPDIWVRIYRDAHVAEALECSHRPPLQATEDADPRVWAYLSEQWRRNLMLGKWLDYLLEHGHGFSMAERPRIVPSTVVAAAGEVPALRRESDESL